MAIVNFVPELWTPQILQNLRNKLVYGSLCNRDYEGEIAQFGDTVHITSFTDPSTRTYTKNADITWDLLTDATRALTIDQSDYFAFTVDDVDRRQALPGFIAKTSVGAAYNLANTVDGFVSGLMVTAVNNGSSDLGLIAASSAENVYDELLVPLRTKLNRQNCPNDGSRWAVLPPEAYAYLLKDSRFIKANESADPAALRTGFVGRAAGFDIYESNTVPDPTAGTYHVVAGHPMATTFADQITETEAIRLQDQFGDGIRGLHLYGAKVVQPACLAMASLTVA